MYVASEYVKAGVLINISDVISKKIDVTIAIP
jgi:hypothetical protein